MPGIYVETLIRGPLEELWAKTQAPALHQRWDLRFSSITYLPRDEGEPQRFLYETKIGLGVAVAGRGESIGERQSESERTSSLRFWSDDWRALIREGSGYWKYIEGQEGVRFFTWYDYQARYGVAGRWFDQLLFRPVMGWATAWSFDRLRMWIEKEITPESALRWTLVYAVSRLSLAAIWLWQGLAPKLLFADRDELQLLAASGLAAKWLPWVGAVEVMLGMAGLLAWRWRGYFPATAALMLVAIVSVWLTIPAYLHHAFNPVTLNLAVTALCAVGWAAYPAAVFAGRCRRTPRTRMPGTKEN